MQYDVALLHCYEMQPLTSPFYARVLLIRLQARGHFGTEAQQRDEGGIAVFIMLIHFININIDD